MLCLMARQRPIPSISGHREGSGNRLTLVQAQQHPSWTPSRTFQFLPRPSSHPAYGGRTSNNLSSLYGYSPLADFWAAHGFAVIQPTHLTSKSLGFDPTTPGVPLFWRSRIEDMSHILDHLDVLEEAVPKSRDGLITVAWPSLDIHLAAHSKHIAGDNR